MGVEIVIDSLEDMCALMCDNRLPRSKKDRKDQEEKDKEKEPHQIAPITAHTM